MPTTKWVDIGPKTEIPEGSTQCVTAADQPIVVCNVAGQMAAVANVCPHAGLPIGEGELRGRVLTCPFHGYSYNVTNGKNIDFPNEEVPVKTYPVRVTDAGRVEIQITQE